jgi:hypothetical protein
MKPLPLTSLERLVLAAAADVDFMYPGMVPHGVFRALVIRGLMQPYRGGYALTAEGRSPSRRWRTRNDRLSGRQRRFARLVLAARGGQALCAGLSNTVWSGLPKFCAYSVTSTASISCGNSAFPPPKPRTIFGNSKNFNPEPWSTTRAPSATSRSRRNVTGVKGGHNDFLPFNEGTIFGRILAMANCRWQDMLLCRPRAR